MERNPADLDVLEAAQALRAGELTSVQLVTACLDRIAKRDPKYQAWIRVYDDAALEAARAADERLRSDPAAPLLCGIPVGIKDVIGVAGQHLTADSAVLEGNVATADATAWARLAAQGAIPLGHLHCGEFACGTWGQNPWDAAFSPGGSSSGSGVALATRTVPATLGSDGRGSIRIPAALNGVTGVKPTFGLVSTAGCVPITWTYDVVGPMARSAADCSVLLAAMVGPDPKDRATYAQPSPPAYPTTPRSGEQPLSGTRIGVPRFADGFLASGVAEAFERCCGELAGLGAELVPYDRPVNPLEADGGRWWKTVLMGEARAIHRQFADRQDLYREEFTSGMAAIAGDDVGDAADYVLGQMMRQRFADGWRGVFSSNRLDAVVEPNQAVEVMRTDLPMDALIDWATEHTAKDLMGLWNDNNFPVVIVPVGHSSVTGGPVACQIAGLPFTEAVLLQIAIDYQAHTQHHRAEPPGLDEPAAVNGGYTPPDRRESGNAQPPYRHESPIFTAVAPAFGDADGGSVGA